MKNSILFLIALSLVLSTQAQNDGVEIEGAVVVGTSASAADGAIRYQSSAFEGHENGIWQTIIPWKASTNGIAYNSVEIDDSGSNGRINLTSPSNVYQLSAESSSITIRDDGVYKIGYYRPDEFGPTENNAISLGSSPYRWMEIWANNPLNTSSDKRLKKNIKPVSYGLSEILKLNPVEYNWIEGHDRKMIGLIAQEVETIIPTVVTNIEPTKEQLEKLSQQSGGRSLDKAAKYTYSLSYTQLIPVLINSIKELNAKVERLESELRKHQN